MGGRRGLKHEETESRDKGLMENSIKSQGEGGGGGVGAKEEEVLLGVCSIVHHHGRLALLLVHYVIHGSKSHNSSFSKVFLGAPPFDSTQLLRAAVLVDVVVVGGVSSGRQPEGPLAQQEL